MTLDLDLTTLGDADLLERASSDDRAFAVLVERHQAFVFGAAFRVTHDHALAEDIAQEAFLRAFRTTAAYRGEGSVRGWLYRIARNLAINAVTRRREIPAAEPVEVPSDRTPEWHLLRTAAIEEVREAIGELPAPLRRCLVMREYDECSYEEISERLDLPLNTVRTRIHRARKALEERLRRSA